MSVFSFNDRRVERLASAFAHSRLVQRERPLQRVLHFTRRSIDDVVNDPVAKCEVLGYYKLHLEIRRSGEITELERQWNDHGLL